MSRCRLSIYIGGTFVDVVTFDFGTGRVEAFKIPTTHHDPAEGVVSAVHRLGVSAAGISDFVHGTTLGLNAILERKGARVDIIANEGFGDIFAIGRGALEFAGMYRFDDEQAPCIVERRHVRGVPGRMDFEGREHSPLDEDAVRRAAAELVELGCEATAISYLHSHVNEAHEMRAAELVRAVAPGMEVSAGPLLANEYREYERTSTAVLVAHIKPVLCNYLGRVPEGIGRGGFTGKTYALNSAHASDALLMTPVFIDGDEIDMFLCVRAHWLDLGAKDAGYVIDSTDTHQKGLLVPGVRIIKEGKLDEDLWNILRFNSRLPDAIEGDFGAQVACLRTGETGVREIFAKFGKARVLSAIEDFFDHAHQKTLAALRELPNGTWSAEDWLDDDGITDDMIRMAVEVTITDDAFFVDYNGSSPQVAGQVNAPFGGTVSMAKTYFNFLTSRLSPSNHGNYIPLDMRADPGTLFHAVYPAATCMPWTKMVAFELIAKALAPVIDWIPMSSGADEPGLMAVGAHHRTGRRFVVSNNEGIDWGATRTHDGATALQHPSTSTVRNTPIKVLERQASPFHEELALIPDSGGVGKYRGGLGVRRKVSMVGETEIISMKKKSKTVGWDLDGGQP